MSCVTCHMSLTRSLNLFPNESYIKGTITHTRKHKKYTQTQKNTQTNIGPYRFILPTIVVSKKMAYAMVSISQEGIIA